MSKGLNIFLQDSFGENCPDFLYGRKLQTQTHGPSADFLASKSQLLAKPSLKYENTLYVLFTTVKCQS